MTYSLLRQGIIYGRKKICSTDLHPIQLPCRVVKSLINKRKTNRAWVRSPLPANSSNLFSSLLTVGQNKTVDPWVVTV